MQNQSQALHEELDFRDEEITILKSEQAAMDAIMQELLIVGSVKMKPLATVQ